MLTFENDTKIGTMNEFQEWLQEQLNLRNWTASKLAAQAGVGPSTITRILTGERGAGKDVCAKIAQVLGEDPDKVFRLAGLLPEKGTDGAGRSKFQEELLYWIGQLPESRQEAVLDIVKGMVATRARQT